jgi:hypothetical protein
MKQDSVFPRDSLRSESKRERHSSRSFFAILPAIVAALLMILALPAALAQNQSPATPQSNVRTKPKPAVVWRTATQAELTALLPARAPVEKEHIETEASTASGITDGKGHFIAGIVLITAGYSADGKYSHYLVVQSPMSIDGIHLTPGDYVIGFSRDEEDSLSVRLYEALTGKPVGMAKAERIPGPGIVRSLRIMPPAEKPLIQIGRFGIPYDLLDKKGEPIVVHLLPKSSAPTTTASALR